jgi:glycolate oxidase iron-sulfur subunit
MPANASDERADNIPGTFQPLIYLPARKTRMAFTNSALLTNALAAEEQKLLACVHCGLCLEACPTYVATGDENDSPRGRIYLMRAVEEERLAVESPSFETHIDRCLGCRACEAACPAGVEYGQLLEAARAEIMQARPHRGTTYAILRFALRHIWLQPRRLRAAFAFARFLRDFKVARILLKTKFAREMSPQFEFALALLDSSSGNRTDRGGERVLEAGRMPANRPQDGTSAGMPGRGPRDAGAPSGAPLVLLFKACVTEGLFQRVNEATRRVLEVNNCAVHAPANQVCCGALHAHAGDLDGARILARQNIDAFAGNADYLNALIITNAGGCGAMLVSYAHLLAGDAKYAEPAREFSARVRDLGQQLEAIGFRNGAAIGSARTTYDASCHLLHGQHGADASLKMLWAIPDLNFALLKDSEVCCGGAGVYNLMEPDLSEEILAEKLKNVEQCGAKVLATGNAGCHMQIAAGARLAGMELRVCHPVELLDESYRRAGLYLEGGNRNQ